LADQAFVARLPQRLLSLPFGGALAVIGHVDMNWPYSWMSLSEQISGRGQVERTEQSNVIRLFIDRLLAGHPIGSAMHEFGKRYWELATIWTDLELKNRAGEEVNAIQHIGIETGMIDIRNYIIIGDPATRLMIADVEEDGEGGGLERLRVQPIIATNRLKFHPKRVLEAAWSPAGDKILTLCDDDFYRLWDANGTGCKVLKTDTRTQRNGSYWSPDGKWVVTIDRNGAASLWNAETAELERRLDGPWEPTGLAAWRLDSAKLAIVGTYSSVMHVIDATSGAVELSLEVGAYAIRSAQWRPVQDHVLMTEEEGGRLRLWDSQSGAQLDTIIEGFDDKVISAWSASGRFLAFSGDIPRLGSYIAPLWDVHIWDGEASEISQLNPGHNGPVVFLQWLSPDDRRLLTLAGDGRLRLWDMGDGQLVYDKAVDVPDVAEVAIDPAGNSAIVIGRNGQTQLYDVTTGEFQADVLNPKGNRRIAAWRPAASDQYLLVDDRTVRIVDLEG
jgi:WD40 repeat protein